MELKPTIIEAPCGEKKKKKEKKKKQGGGLKKKKGKEKGWRRFYHQHGVKVLASQTLRFSVEA